MEPQLKYLLDNKQFQKYHELLTPRSNLDFIKKIQGKQLLYSRKFYPVTSSELDVIKTHLKNLHEKFLGDEEKEKKEEEEKEKTSSKIENFDEETTKHDSPQKKKEEEEKEEEVEEEEEKEGREKEKSPLWKPSRWQSFKLAKIKKK